MATIDYAKQEAAWACTLVRKLTQDEAPGSHHVYINVNRDGVDVRGQVAIRFGWDGMQPEEAPSPMRTDKPKPEPACNIPLWPGQNAWVEVADAPSDRVVGLDAYGGWLVEFTWRDA